MSDSGVRKKSEVRQKTVVRTLRFSPAEDETIRKKAEDSGLTVSAYIRNAALNKRINSRTDDAFLKELMRLGRMQKHLFVQGKRTGDREYAEVLVAITELTNTLRKQLMEGLKWFTEFGHLNRGDMLTSEQHRCHNEKKKFQRRV